jgi:PadR family transcriptional regulator PadR
MPRMAGLGGTFQQAVLISVGALHGRGDAAAVLAEVERRLGREIPSGAVHITLQRLERKRMISSKPTADRRRRDGHGPRHYRIEPAGVRALADARAEVERAWQGVASESK